MEPYPGDGVCSTKSQSFRTTEQGEATWSNLKAVATLETVHLSVMETLVKLLCSIPSLAFDSRKSLFINYEAANSVACLQFAFD